MAVMYLQFIIVGGMVHSGSKSSLVGFWVILYPDKSGSGQHIFLTFYLPQGKEPHEQSFSELPFVFLLLYAHLGSD